MSVTVFPKNFRSCAPLTVLLASLNDYLSRLPRIGAREEKQTIIRDRHPLLNVGWFAAIG